MLIQTELMTFDVHVDEERKDGWTFDCNGKMDYDPTIVRLSSRVYRDGTHISSVYVGGDTRVLETGVLHATDHAAALRAVEDWSKEQAAKIIAAVTAAYMDAAVGDWQPIETAPTDGAFFVGWSLKHGRVIVSQKYEGNTLVTETWQIDPSPWLDAEPTHWSPLPAHPASVTGTGTAETRNVAQGEACQNGPQGDAQ